MKKPLDYSMINKKHIDLVIHKNEILRYLGYSSKNVDEVTSSIIDTCTHEILDLIKTNFVYNIYEINRGCNDISLQNSNLKLVGNDIYRHLQNCEKCVVMAVTLGTEVDQRIKYYSKIDLTKSLVFDATATTAVEALCDRVEAVIKRIALNNGYNTTSRYSPGYGDLPIEIQPKILKLLDTSKHIGLTVTDSCILIPRKSVTAVIGIGEEVKSQLTSCENCRLYNNCLFVKEGDSCGYSKTTKQ
jgi:ribosomal protein L30E